MRRSLTIVLLAVAALLSGFAVVAYVSDAFEELDLDSVDARFSLRGEQDPPGDVVVVEIDDVTFDELELQWPFPRAVHGRLLDRLRAARPEVIAYDVQFTEPSQRGPQDDEALIRAAARAPGLVLATTEVNEFGESAILGGDALLADIGARAGNSNFPIDPGGVLRRVTPLVDGLESLSRVAAETYTSRGIRDFPGGEGGAWIDFPGPPETVRTYSFSRVLEGRVPAERFTDKIVVVGASAPSLQDVHPTSTTGSELMSGPEIHAAAIQTILEDFPLREPGAPLDIPLIVLMGLAVPLLSLRVRLRDTFLLAVGLGLVYLVLTYVLFRFGVVVTLVYPLLALGLTLVLTMALSYARASFDREYVRSIFARFVPESVVSEVLSRADGLRLGGTERDVTMMFSDIRGFTTFSEQHDPADVIEILNRYLSQMSDAIMAAGGTLVAFMGDGIMATFGAPIEDPRHADKAVNAGREMLARLEDFNRWMVDERGAEPFRIGIGLHSGPVISGNVGSDQRLEYTTIGDTTNTASRIEGLTKTVGAPLLISEATKERLSELPGDLVFAGEHEIRGRTGRVKLWSLEEDVGH